MGLIRRYRDILPVQFFDLRYERLVYDYEAESRRLLTFAGLMNPTEVPGPAVYASQAEKVASISTVGRWQNYTDFLEPVWGDLTSFIRRYGYTD